MDSFDEITNPPPPVVHPPVSCHCLICFKEFSMMSALNSHLAAQHPILTTIVPPEVFLDAADVPLTQDMYDSLELNNIFKLLTDAIAKLQKDETRNKYSHLDYTTQLICKIKSLYMQIDNAKKELYKYGAVYTSEFPEDKMAQDVTEKVSVGPGASTSAAPAAHTPITEPVPAPAPEPVPVPAEVPLPVPIPINKPITPHYTSTITITTYSGEEIQFLKDDKGTCFQCTLCCKDLHSRQACMRHGCVRKKYCEKCDCTFHTAKEYENHKNNTTIVRVPDNLLEPIPFNISQNEGVYFNKKTFKDCYRITWENLFRIENNQFIKKNKHSQYLIHKGCNKWETKDQKQLKWHLIYSLSKLLSKHTPNFFGKVIQRIEDTYTNNKDFKDLDKEFSQYSSGWWILPEKKARKKRVVKKVGGKAAVAKPNTTTKQVTTKPQEASTSTQAETKPKKTRKLREKPNKPQTEEEASTSAAAAVTIVVPCQVSHNGRNFYKNKNSYRCLHCGVVLRSGKGCLGHVC